MAYKVKLDIFEGPMDLLVYLIEHARMSIYDIRVSEITTQYLEYVRALREQDVAVAQEFMVLAAELIELKSRMLLPSVAEEIEKGEIEDPRAALVARIVEYKQYKDMAGFFDEQAELVSHIHTKPQEDLSPYSGEEDILLKTDMDDFVAAFKLFILKKQRLEEVRRIYERAERARMSIETRIGQIRDLFRSRKKAMFSEMIADDDSPAGRVITFLSLLELLKEGSITAEQKVRYGDIEVRPVQAQ